MIEEPISNPPSQPTSPVRPIEENPSFGTGEPKPFNLPQEGPKGQPITPSESKPTPMEVARDSARGQGWSQEEIQSNMERLQQQLAQAKTQLQNPNITKNLTPDHFAALDKLTDKMNPDMRSIAKLTGNEFTPPLKGKDSLLNSVLKWVGGSQDMMESALAYAGSMKNPNPQDMLRLQFSMHRATERGELFSSIIGSTVSGIKTIMSAQLG